MKRIIFGALLGTIAVASAVTARGQGYVIFSSYFANNGAGALTTYASSGSPVGNTFHANLYFAFGTVSDPNGGQDTFPGSIMLPGGGFNFVAGPNSTQAYLNDGYFGFTPQAVAIPGYSSGPVTFEVVVWSGGSSYGDPQNTARARSTTFTMNSIALAGNPVPTLGDNGQPMPDIHVFIPEPTTLALAGLGALFLLISRRRK